MNTYYIINSKVISFIFMVCLITPNISFSNNQNSETTVIELTSQQTIGTPTSPNHQTKEVLTEDRELDTFFIVGLIINFIMMTTFAIWAIGQWRQNDKKNKTSNSSSRKSH